ncbi:hypothetical protein [Aestuariibius sp. HNIBRBA575]
MSNLFKALAAVSVLGLAACGNNDVEEFVVVDPAPTVSAEPVFNGKYN